MSIYGAESERSLEPLGEKLDLVAATRSGLQHGLSAMSYPSQEPGLPSDLWYNPGPHQQPPHPPPQPSLVSELPFVLPSEHMAPGSFPPASYTTQQSHMFPPQYVKPEPGAVSELNVAYSHLPFIKQELGLHNSTTAPHPLSRPDQTPHNGSPHLPLDMAAPGGGGDARHHVHPLPPHGHPSSHFSLPPSSLPCSTHTNSIFIKQEPGVRNHGHLHQRHELDPNEGAPGPPMHIKQEPGLLGHIKQEPGTPHSFHGDPFYEPSVMPFPSKPINFNFMADIEDIVRPTNSELAMDRLKCELAGFEAPYGCYGLGMGDGKELEMMHMKREEEPIWEPPLWRQQYDNIRTMRSKRDAPVDKYGCFMNAERDVSPKVRRYQVLVSLMLSSQTKDEVVSKAMTKLKENGLTIDNVLETPQEEIARMIFPVGFWNKKAEYIKKTTKILLDKFDSDIPNSVEGLVSLPGIGPKMAHLIMDFAWGEVSGIAVDTHVHRITHRLGWMPREARSPEEARKILERWFPKSEWSDLNLLFVGFGQQVCSPVGPKCSECLNKDLCPSSSCGVSTGLPLGLGIEVSTKSKGKRGSKSNSTKPKKVKVES